MASARPRAYKNNRNAKKPIAPAARRVQLPRRSKGRRPQFYADPAIDQLFAIVTALTGELSVVFDRVDTVERALVAARALNADAIATYTAPRDVADARSRNREELLRRVFAVLEAYADRQTSSPR